VAKIIRAAGKNLKFPSRIQFPESAHRKREDLTSALVRNGYFERRQAIAPETTGAAMDVPVLER